MSLIRFTLIQFPTSYALSNFISDYTLRPSISTYTYFGFYSFIGE